MRRPVSLGARVRTTVSTSGNSGTRFRVEQNIVPFHFHRVAVQLNGGIKIVFAGAAILGPLMPRTGNDVVLQNSLSDRAAGVRANSPRRMQCSALVAKRGASTSA